MKRESSSRTWLLAGGIAMLFAVIAAPALAQMETYGPANMNIVAGAAGAWEIQTNGLVVPTATASYTPIGAPIPLTGFDAISQAILDGVNLGSSYGLSLNKNGVTSGSYDTHGVFMGPSIYDVPAGTRAGAGADLNPPGGGDPLRLTTIGWMDNSLLSYPQFGVQTNPVTHVKTPVSVDGSDTLIRYTYFGDADLNGQADPGDLDYWLAGYTDSGLPRTWLLGDFNHDGSIDPGDLDYWLAAYTSGLPPLEASPARAGASPNPVPEPSTIVLTLASLIGLCLVGLRRFPERITYMNRAILWLGVVTLACVGTANAEILHIDLRAEGYADATT